VAALRLLSITWKRSFSHIVFQKELQMVLYHVHICVFPFSFLWAHFAVSVVRLMQSSLHILVSWSNWGSNAASNANGFHYASPPFMSVRSIVPTPLIGSRRASPLRFLLAATGRRPQWTCKAPICRLHPFSPPPLYHLPFAESVASAGLPRAGLAPQEHWIFLPRPSLCSRHL
jgi:hypothetical protein